jgi:hypothetical protein
MTARWDTPAALTALLDALEADLLGASKEDVQAALRETGRAKEGAVREIRSLLRDAEGDSGDRYPLALPSDEHDEMGTQRH